MLIKWLTEDDQLKHWLQWEKMTPPDISDTGCISDKRKICVHIKAHTLDFSKHDRSGCRRCAIGDKANAFAYVSTLKLQDAIWYFFSSFKERREQTALPTVNRRCLKACHWASQSERNKKQVPEDRHVHTHAVYTLCFSGYTATSSEL